MEHMECKNIENTGSQLSIIDVLKAITLPSRAPAC